MKSPARLLCLLWVVVLTQSCSDKPASPEAEIRDYIRSGVEAAENRGSDALAGLMHDSYTDHKGYNKKQLEGLLRAYFFRHKNIHLFTRVDEIELLTENEAIVQLHVAMAGKVITDVDALSALRAQVYRFELQLIKQDEWLLRQAVWQPASLGDFN